MAKEKTLMWVVIAALVLVAGLSFYTVNRLSVTSEQPAGTVDVGDTGEIAGGGISAELYGKAATVSLAGFDDQADTATQVAGTAYLWVNGVYAGTVTLSSSARASFTDAVVGDTLKIIAFDATYPYGQEATVVVDKTSKLVNLDVSAGSASQSITFYNEDGDAVADPTGTGVTVGSTNYIFDKIRIQNTDDKSLYKTQLIGFDYADETNITEIRVSGLTRFTGSVRRLKTVEDWFMMQQNLNDEQTRFDTGSVTVVPDGDNVAAETVTVYVLDNAPYINKENALAYGYENDDSNPADVGLADISQAIKLV